MLMPAVLQLSSIIIKKVLNEKIFSYSVLESSRRQLLDSRIKSRLFCLKKIYVTLI